MTARPGLAAFVLAVLTASAPAWGQTPPMVVERPSFSTPPEVVGAGWWQVEAGVEWTRDVVGDAAGQAVTAPNVVVRLGMFDRVELRAATAGYVGATNGGPRDHWRHSAGDVAVGVKYQLATQDGLGAGIALVPMVSLPTGGSRASSGSADPSVILTVARAFGASTLNGNVKWSAPTVHDAEPRRVRTVDTSLVLSRDLWVRWNAFAEGVATSVDVADTPVAWRALAGIARSVSGDLVLDLYGGVGLNDAAPDWTLGAGFAWRRHR